jgi:hypothetical protein
MKVGTRSVLFGAHCFFLHPWFVAIGWLRLYGFRRVYVGYAPGNPQSWRWRIGIRGGPVFGAIWDPRVWVAFFVHDIGYLGKPNMDGKEGERHVELGARIMSALFDRAKKRKIPGTNSEVGVWGLFSLCHSRYYAKAVALPLSPLTFADKLSLVYIPAWLYLPLVSATGEIKEYLKNAENADSGHWTPGRYDKARWLSALKVYMADWVAAHKDGSADTWTNANRHAKNSEGVWQ